MNSEHRIGIDIGRVIIAGDQPGGDTSFIGGSMDEVLRTPAIPGALAAIARLHTLFAGRVWLISKCGRRVEERSRVWLLHHRFHEQTGVPEEHLRFCRERPQKRDHAVELGLTHFVDDRTDVLAHLAGVVPHLFLFGPQNEPVPSFATHVATWDEAEEAIAATLALTPCG
ncbi:MAG TPA: hypothetical protein VF432_04420 [Thermoanaerobaculia bacterium]